MDKTKTEVLRYLGRRGQDVPEDLSVLVDECVGLMREASVPRHVMRVFDISAEPDGIHVTGTGLILRGGDIERHLSGCGQAVLLAITLGAGADSLIRGWKRADLTRSLVLDACATQLTEEVCDALECQARSEAAKSGLKTARRYSPGYGDFPMESQPDILAALDAGKRIGLTCTDSFILLPRKSVTAVIGLGENIEEAADDCGGCNLRDTCGYVKDKN